METQFEIVVEALPDNHIPVLRAIREMLGSSLKESKELLTYVKASCPCILIAGVEQTLAENFANRLISVGVEAKVRASSMSRPMLIYPRLDKRCQYHWFFGLQNINGEKI
ncbi:MAG: hypothetical protein F6K42_03170 [Leptolyngbya sp. SIO1D8]|nr:hypothetical protein [Leptolyngbya sp. SIO1D8]